MSLVGQPPLQRRRWPAWAVVLVVLAPVFAVLLVLAAVMGDDGDGPSIDPQDAAACQAFWDAASDYNDGVLTIGELRGRFQDVNDAADGATGPVARAARLLLAAATSHVERLPAAIADMDDACADAVG